MQAEGRNTDHDSILVPWGSADIFFPTDFDALVRRRGYCVRWGALYGAELFQGNI